MAQWITSLGPIAALRWCTEVKISHYDSPWLRT